MFETIAEWWTRLKNWAIASTVGSKRETVESYLETAQAQALAQQWADYLAAGNRRYPQILRGGGKPSDRPDELSFIPNVPGWLDYEVHAWEGPAGTGWKLYVYVTEQGKDWKLEIEYPWDAPEWTQTKPLVTP